MSLLPPSSVDLKVLDSIAQSVEGAIEQSEKSPILERFKSALDQNSASLEEVAVHLGQQLNTPFEERTRTKAIDTILQVHGLVGPKRDRNSGGDIKIVVHTNEANLQSNMFAPQRSE